MTDDDPMTTGADPGDALVDDEPILPISPATRRRLMWLVVGLVIALIAGGAGFAIGGASRDGTVDDLNAQVSRLGDVADAAVRIDAEPDARHVALVPGTAGDRSAGEVVLAPGSGRLLVIAIGLAPEPAGFAYWAWVEQSGQPRLLGALTWAGGAWSWSGTVDGLATLGRGGAAYRVSLVGAGGGAPGDAVLSAAP